MLFKAKPHLFMQFLDRSIKYLVMDSQRKTLIEKDELVFDTAIVQEGRLTNVPLLQARLDALIKEKKWKNAKVSIVLPDDFVTIREEEIPAQLASNEIKDYLNLHINQSIRLPFDHPKVDYEVISRNETTQTLFLAAYPVDQVRHYLDLLEGVSLKPEVADISSLCVYRILNQQTQIKLKEEDHVMVLQWNPVDTSITVFNKGIPQFNRHTRSQRLMESWDLTKEGKWEWKRTDEELKDNLEDQLNGLERFMDFYRYSVMDGKDSVSAIVLSGYFPDLERLKRLLDERFTVKISLVDLPSHFVQADSVLYGLSLKEPKSGQSLFGASKENLGTRHKKTGRGFKKVKNLTVEGEGEVAK